MSDFTLKEIQKITRGDVVQGDMSDSFKDISIDSRTVNPGDLFIAIKGDNFDGHEFVFDAVRKGAKGAVISKKEALKEELFHKNNGFAPSVIVVDNTLAALQKIAQHLREQIDIPFIAVTGSNGKTTSKEMIASVLETKYAVLKNEGNYNNHIGVPLTLLKLMPSHDISVLEMGMSGLGEIRRLCEIAKPNTGVLTNISGVHLEFLGSIEKVKEAKGELVESIDEKGTVILNFDDPLVKDLKKKVRGKLITYGIDNQDSDIKAERIMNLGINGSTFLLTVGNEEIEIHLPAIGGYNIYNALAAAAVGFVHNVGLENIKKGLEAFRGFPMRMEICPIDDTIKIINDSYNANPLSMKKAAETLSGIDKKGRSFFVAGDMLELGDASKEAHEDLGRFIAGQSIDFLIVVGELASSIGKGALESGMKEERVLICNTLKEASGILDEQLKSDDIVLIKGSRGMRMEKIIEELKKTREIQ